jgi:uncharacterized protein with HEPN domain
MNSHQSWRPYAMHILKAAAGIDRLVARGDLFDDEDIYDSALRKLQTLAEATRQLPESFKEANPDIDWRAITAFRNIVTHAYLGETIDMKTVKNIIEQSLPPLRKAVNDMLEQDSKE